MKKKTAFQKAISKKGKAVSKLGKKPVSRKAAKVSKVVANPPRVRTHDVLFELGIEEIPARFMGTILEDLKNKTAEKLAEARLSHGAIHILGTPRRLAVIIEKVPEFQADLTREAKGPPKKVAFDADGNPTAAAAGFARNAGVDVAALTVKNDGGREYLVAQIFEKGRPTKLILAALFPEIIQSLHLPKSMRWGKGEFTFIRPIHWITCFYGADLIRFHLGELNVGATTEGHRILTGGKKIALSLGRSGWLTSYRQALKTAHVIVDPKEREAMIRQQFKAIDKKGAFSIDEGLLKEVLFLIEEPFVIQAGYEPVFWETLPHEVLYTVLQSQQRCFPSSKDNHFLVVVDGKRAPFTEIREGNERVVRARLSDARFFFNEDLKKPLGDLRSTLNRTKFHEKLGSIGDKVARIEALTKHIGKQINLSSAQTSIAETVAALAKCDLATHMVGEFGVLQGIMGREYVLRQSAFEPLSERRAAAADGIFEHYLPRYEGDRLPKGLAGAVVGVADRIDTLVGFFAMGLIPTGSEDPFALRRTASGLAQLLIRTPELSGLPLHKLIATSLEIYVAAGFADIHPELTKPKIIDFLTGRLRQVLLDEKIRHDVADAVLNSRWESLGEAHRRAQALNKQVSAEWFRPIFLTGDRVARLAVNATREEVKQEDFIDQGEGALYDVFLRTRDTFEHSMKEGQIDAALKTLEDLSAPVHTFFEKVMVMAEDPRLRENRLALLKSMDNTFKKIADFTKLAM